MDIKKSTLPICEHIQSFEPYVAGLSIDEIKEKYQLEHVIKMASNENPFGSSKLAQKSMAENVHNAFRYPQAGNPKLVKALAAYYRKKYPFLTEKQIFVGNGSDEIIDLLFRVLTIPNKHNAVMFKPCFGLYSTQAKVQNCEIRTVPLKEDFGFDFAGLRALVDENTALVLSQARTIRAGVWRTGRNCLLLQNRCLKRACSWLTKPMSNLREMKKTVPYLLNWVL